ncbi:MAG: methyltransferase [Verrucomicrobia bacterium]|nr:methyltransferase [Verrucomicrobiota bacterium]
MPTEGYELVRLANGTAAVHSLAHDEKMHPGLGPAAEAEALYVGQLKIRERLAAHDGEFVVWDVGLGAAANAMAVLRAARDFPCPLRLVSFDNTLEPLAFALEHADALGYLRGYEELVEGILNCGRVRFMDGRHEVSWEFLPGDFPAWCAQALDLRSPDQRVGVHALACPGSGRLKPELQPVNAPHAILFDAFSPATNPAMWTLPLFANLLRLLDPARPCNLTTYSRSTMIRVTLLLAGFFVGRGIPTGLKEETTLAANKLELIDEPLDRRWLERARRSESAEPLHEEVYRRLPLALGSSNKLHEHPQFIA